MKAPEEAMAVMCCPLAYASLYVVEEGASYAVYRWDADSDRFLHFRSYKEFKVAVLAAACQFGIESHDNLV